MDKQAKEIAEAMEKKLPEVIDGVVTEKVAELSEKTFKEVSEVKAELKKLAIAQKETKESVSLKNKTAMISIIKNVWTNNINNEKAFKQVVETEMKAMNEGTSGEGAELVFDQFSRDVLNVINEYELVTAVKKLNLVKGDKISLPKVINGTTTAYVAEAGAPSDSQAVTSYVTIDIYKAVTLVNMTDEILDDNMTIPDLYNLIVRLMGESQAEFLEKEILLGTGSNAIEGILVNSDVNEVALGTAEKGADIDDTTITKVLTTALKKYKKSKSNLRWIMSQYTYGLLRAIKTTDGYPLYPTLRDATPMLEGSKVMISDEMPVQNSTADVADAVQLIYGDPTYFTLVTRKNLTMERGYYGNNWKDGINSLKGTQRFGGKCTFGEALTKLVNGPAS